tara:strand:- start:647 stop:877 length:231 start_codon:yes stop_codon:yes gene_type:complete
MKITSEKLQETQDVLQELAKNEIGAPMTNYIKLNRLLKVIQNIDDLRRETWSDEKFGPYEELADNLVRINSDDIPF